MFYRRALLISCFVPLAIHSFPADAQERIIRAPDSTSRPVLSPGGFLWDPTNRDYPSRLTDFAKIAYVQGFWDAITLLDAKAPAIPRLSKDYDGMSISQIVSTMNRFYSDNPQWRDYNPAIVLLVVIPRLRKGLSPLEPLK